MDNGNKNGISGLEQFDEIMEKLQQMGRSIDYFTTEKALRAGAKILKEKVINHPNMPVSNELKKHARDDIKIKKIDEELFEVGYPKSSGKSFYLYFYEIGTKAGTYVGDNGNLYKMPNISAKPFFRPAFEGSIREIEAEIIKVIRKGLRL